VEDVLVLQGGGSLGAFGCGVFKALKKNNINLDIIAGTSIGGINAAIIAGSKNNEHPEQLLEEFWLELSESFIDLEKFDFFHTWHGFIEQFLQPSYNYLSKMPTVENYPMSRKELETKIKQVRAFFSAAVFGNDKMFKPRWLYETPITDPEYFSPQRWTYMYDHSPLVKTLEK
jgi:NTE family protein